MQLVIGRSAAPPGDREVEVVERKGLGHPDSICDALAEAFSLELCRFYRERMGGILHHNVDKALLVAGRSQPRFGGGQVLEPMRIVLAGRASLERGGIDLPVAELAEQSVRRWLGRHLHAFDPERHVVVETRVRAGSRELVELFGHAGGARRALANDTSCGVGHAPLSELEGLVLAVEQRLNAESIPASDPALGEDVKVMGVRRNDTVQLTVACAMVDGALRDLADYGKAVERVAELALDAASRCGRLRSEVAVNAADDRASGSVYLTVTGTSAEAGDDGQAGRGNRVNGLITPGRPMTIESVAGKNPVSHVGKLYNLAAGLVCQRLVAELHPVRGAECLLVSRIGAPIDEPQIAELRITGAEPDPALRREIEGILRDELARLPQLADDLMQGALQLDRWPLRTQVVD
jgi:S-adenosylmethionine synthetase